MTGEPAKELGRPVREISPGRRWAGIGFALVFPTVVTWAYFVWLEGHASSLQQTAYTVGKSLQFAFPALWAVLALRESISWRRPSGAGVGLGLAFGALLFVAIQALYGLWLGPSGWFDGPTEIIVAKVRGLQLNSPARFLALGLFYSLAHSLMEEYYWRWFVFGQLRKVCSLGPALVIGSAGFMAHHVILLATYFGWYDPATWFFSASVFVGGVAWSWLYERSGSLLGPWLSHLLVDAAIFLVGFQLLRGHWA